MSRQESGTTVVPLRHVKNLGGGVWRKINVVDFRHTGFGVIINYLSTDI